MIEFSIGLLVAASCAVSIILMVFGLVWFMNFMTDWREDRRREKRAKDRELLKQRVRAKQSVVLPNSRVIQEALEHANS